MKDIIKEKTVTVKLVEKSYSIMNKVFIKRITAKQEIYNSMSFDFFLKVIHTFILVGQAGKYI